MHQSSANNMNLKMVPLTSFLSISHTITKCGHLDFKHKGKPETGPGWITAACEEKPDRLQEQHQNLTLNYAYMKIQAAYK